MASIIIRSIPFISDYEIATSAAGGEYTKLRQDRFVLDPRQPATTTGLSLYYALKYAESGSLPLSIPTTKASYCVGRALASERDVVFIVPKTWNNEETRKWADEISKVFVTYYESQEAAKTL